MATEKQVTKLLESTWLESGETLYSVFGGEGVRGHIGGTLAGELVVPWPAADDAPAITAEAELEPLTEVVRDGRFVGDEWVHDPGLRAWVRADRDDQLAARCAGYLAAAGAEGWYVTTDRRIAVMVQAGAAPQAQPAEPPSSTGDSEQSSGIGGLLGRARSAVSDVAGSLVRRTGPVVLWEHRSEKTAASFRPMGRAVPKLRISRTEFEDGSLIEGRTGRDWP